MKRAAAILAASIACLAGAAELPRSGFLGVQLVPAPDGKKGALVQGVIDGGSAKAVGLAANDIVTSVNGAPVDTPADLVAGVAKLRAGDPIAVEYLRDGVAHAGSASIRPKPYESASDVDTRYEVVEANGALRRSIVTAPRSPDRHPGVLYITGVGCFSQEDASLQTTQAKLIYGLTRAGFVTMRVEKSGMGDSRGPSCMSPEADLRSELAGYEAGLAALKKDPSVDPAHVFVVGLSLGGIEAPIVAQGGVNGVVVINTLARPFLEYLMETRRRQAKLHGTPFDEIDKGARLGERCNHEALVEGRETGPECADSVSYPAPMTLMRQWTAIDPAAEWKKVDTPVLIVYGGTDFVATGDTDAPYLRDMVESFHPGNATLVRIDTMDHYMGHAPTMEEALARTQGLLEPFEPRVLETVRGWLERHSTG